MSETKPPAIDRKDPQWGMFAAAYIAVSVSAPMIPLAEECADFADAMLRERDRRDREEREPSAADRRFADWQKSPPKAGDLVTVVELLSTEGFMISPKHIHGRHCGPGRLSSYAPGHGGDVWFVRHDDCAEYQAYCLTELERREE